MQQLNTIIINLVCGILIVGAVLTGNSFLLTIAWLLIISVTVAAIHLFVQATRQKLSPKNEQLFSTYKTTSLIYDIGLTVFLLFSIPALGTLYLIHTVLLIGTYYTINSRNPNAL